MEYKFKYPVGTQLVSKKNKNKQIDEVYKYIIDECDASAILLLNCLDDDKLFSEPIPIEDLYKYWDIYKYGSGNIEYNFKYNIGDILLTHEGRYIHYDKLKAYTIMNKKEYASVLLDYDTYCERMIHNISIRKLYDNWKNISLEGRKIKKKKK